MLDLIGAIVGMSIVAINLVAFTHALGGTLTHRLGLSAIIGAWVGLAVGLGAAGKLAFAAGPVPLIGVLAAVPLLTVAVLALSSQRVRSALLAVPMPLLIGLNSLRVLGVLFLLLAISARLSGPFPYFAGFGDLITAAFALSLALSFARSRPPSAAAIRNWNIFGALDLVIAVALGVTSASGSPVQLIHAGVGSEAVQYLPYCLVPAVLVPYYLITHAIVAAQLRAPRAAPALSHA